MSATTVAMKIISEAELSEVLVGSAGRSGIGYGLVLPNRSKMLRRYMYSEKRTHL